MTADAAHGAAVAEALYGSWSVGHQPVSQAMARGAANRDATVAVETLTPLIEAALRERIAADIEADVLLSPFSGGREVNAYNHGARNAASHAARIVRSGVPRTEEARTGPHSRACGIKRHDHGTECHSNCPTCRGSEVPR